MPDYRWGIFLNPGDPNRKVHFGDHMGEAAWQDVPGEYRANLRRIIVTQGDTEPASVEQQRHLGLTCPSQYDLRNLFQVNVEEGRHLWAMVYLLHKYFGKDGREEGEALLERRSGNEDNPRILQAFNEKTPDWLSFFMFTYFTDRDGKFQLSALAESAFDPLARTTKFMLTEEAHHMFVGESGVSRVIQRTCQVMNELKTDDPKKLRAAGVIDLPTLQRYLNFHYSVTIDLFGADESSNAATFYSTGLKGRFEEGKRTDDHQLRGQSYKVLHAVNGQLSEREVPMLNALNEVLRDDYIKDSMGGVGRWNKVIEKAGIPFRLTVPHKAFHRNIGALAGVKVSPEGRVISEAEWNAKVGEWLPTAEDRAFVASLMGRVVEPGKFANWIAPPVMGINRQPVRFRVHPLRLSGKFARRRCRRARSDHGRIGRHLHQAAPDRPRDLHPLQHLRSDLPGQCDHARQQQLRRGRRQVQPVHGLRVAMPHGQHRQLADHAEGEGLFDRGTVRLGVPARGAQRGRAGGSGWRRGSRRDPAAGGGAVRRGIEPGETTFRSADYGATVPPWSAAHAYTNLYGPKAAAKTLTATVTGNVRVTEVGKEYDTHHVVLDFGSTPFPVLEGQSIAIVPPGLDERGKPHFPRQYSIASARNGERPGYNNISLTIKRVLEDHEGRPVRGVASNYMCDLKVGDKVEVIGPFGASFLMPNHPRSHIVMICTGTGSAPMRAMTEWRRRLRNSGKFEGGKLMLFFGARTREELPYFGPLQKPAQGLHRHEPGVQPRSGPAQALRAGPDARTRRGPGATARRPECLLLCLRAEGDGRGRGARPA